MNAQPLKPSLKHLLLLAALAAMAVPSLGIAADTPRDSDGVPQVNLHGRIVETQPASVVSGIKLEAQRQRLVAVDGKEMPLLEFIKTYCQGKRSNATCGRALAIRRIDNISGPTEGLPKGL